MRKLIVDIRGEASPEAGWRMVQSEVEFVQALQNDTGPLMVRGKSLCQWAAALWAARNWPAEQLFTLADELLLACPDMTREHAQAVLKTHYDALHSVARPLNLRRICDTIFACDLWQQSPSLHHAAQWLLWLDEQSPADCYRPLLKAWTSLWKAHSSGPEAIVYDAVDEIAARELLAGWLGYGPLGHDLQLPTFPANISAGILDAAERVWMPRIIETKGHYFNTLATCRLPRALLYKAAELTCQYYTKNRDSLTNEAIRTLTDYIAAPQLQELRRLLPPPPPCEPPNDPAAVIKWFRDSYVPYRQWATATRTTTAQEKVHTVWSSFVDWYVGYYPSAIARGDDCVLYFRSAKTQARLTEDVVLMVVLDGLNWPDADTLRRYILRDQRRMTLVDNGLGFAAIPTVTEFCKPAIVHGCSPRDRERCPPNARVRRLPEGTAPAAALSKAVPGQVLIWTLAEPDKTYHSKGDADVIAQRVEGELQTCAARICEACEQVPSHLKLMVIITTDHGRLIGDSQRTQRSPAGMQAHQRAAWGPAEYGFPVSGVLKDPSGEVVILHGPRFGISDAEHCAIMVTDHAFFTQDGKTGTEHYPHGGLLPEEVIVPWIELVRDASAPELRCVITGKAREGRPGQIAIELVNSSRIDLLLVSVSFTFGKDRKDDVTIGSTISALTQMTCTETIANWPTKRSVLSGSAEVCVRLPSGQEYRAAAELRMDSESLYVRDDDLLDGLV